MVVGQDIGAADLAFFVFQPAPNDETWRSFRVSASDGQLSSAPATVVITLAAVNDIPTLVAVSPTSSSRPSLGGTGIPSTRIDVYADGKLIGSAQTSPDGIWSMVLAAPLPDGTYSLTATSTESSNETSPPSAPVTLIVDTRAPQVPTIGVASPTSDQFPLISGAAEPGSRVQVAIDGSFLGITPVDAAGRWTLRPSSAISGGSYTLVATSQDAAGNRSGPSSPARLVIDRTAPAAPVIQSPVTSANLRPEIQLGAARALGQRQVRGCECAFGGDLVFGRRRFARRFLGFFDVRAIEARHAIDYFHDGFSIVRGSRAIFARSVRPRFDTAAL